MSGKLAKLLSELKETEALAFVDEALGSGTAAEELLEEAQEGMNEVGQKFANGQYFIQDLIYSGEILKGIVKKLEE